MTDALLWVIAVELGLVVVLLVYRELQP